MGLSRRGAGPLLVRLGLVALHDLVRHRLALYGLVYYRLHGSPKVYYSAYRDEYLETLATTLTRAAKSAGVWCIFDNTAAFAATANALDVLDRVRA